MFSFKSAPLLFLLLLLTRTSQAGQEPETATRHQKLILPDDHAAVWMTMDNEFAGQAVHERRVGILFQLGYFWSYANQHAPDKDLIQTHSECEGVRLTMVDHDGHQETYQYSPGDEFTWINVFPAPEGGNLADPRIKQKDADRLFPNDRVQTYSGIVPDTDLRFPDDGKRFPDFMSKNNPVFCLPKPAHRDRRLHAFHEPLACMTYWQGESGYTLQSRYRGGENPNESYQNRYEWSLLDEVWVDVYNGEAIVDRHKNVQTIMIVPEGSVTHTQLHNPPVSWGPIANP